MEETKPTHKGLYAALAAAQAEMGRALKDATNPAFKSKYADLASVCDACMPALAKHGIAVLQPPYDDETGRYVKTIFVHGGTGESVECRVPLIVAKNDMQGYGSAATYARRYGLMGMAGIAPEDDDGNAAAAAPMVETAKQKPVQPYDPKPHVQRIEAAMTGKDLLAAIKAPGCDNEHDAIRMARLARIEHLMNGAPDLVVLAKLQEVFAPDMTPTIMQAAAYRKEELERDA